MPKYKFPWWSLVLVVVCSFIIGVVWLTGMQFTHNLPATPAPKVESSDLPSLAPMVEKTSKAVVNISTIRVIKGPGPVFKYFFGPFGEEDPFREFFERFFGEVPQPEMKQKSLGSGLLLIKMVIS